MGGDTKALDEAEVFPAYWEDSRAAFRIEFGEMVDSMVSSEVEIDPECNQSIEAAHVESGEPVN